MPRLPKPFRWRDGWYTDAGGKRSFLLPKTASFTAAQNALRQLLGEHDQNGGRATPNLTVAELVALYLDMVKVEKEADTYEQYRRNLNKFVRLHGTQQARQITPLDAQNFKNSLVASVNAHTGKPLKNRTINIALIVLRCCWNWAIESEGCGLVKNPFQKVELLPEHERQRIATDEEFQLLLRHSDALFRQVLLCLRYMPLRPQDLRTRLRRRRRRRRRAAGQRLQRRHRCPRGQLLRLRAELHRRRPCGRR